MTDAELIEAAASAAGYRMDGPAEPHVAFDAKGALLRVNEHGGHSLWNPLTDDGDALRLAVKLRLNIEHMETMSRKTYGINCWPVGRGDCGVTQDEGLTDYAGATRRAIVRAAAALSAPPNPPSKEMT